MRKMQSYSLLKSIIFVLFSFLLVASNANAAETLLNFNEKEGWFTNKPGDGEIKTSLSEGFKNTSALRLDYNFKPGGWVEAGTKFTCDPEKMGVITFMWRGSTTGVIYELKFIDEDETTFGLKMPTKGIKETEWTEISIPWSDCSVMWGGNLKLDKITEVRFALSGKGGKGFIEICDFKNSPAGSYIIDVEINQIGYQPLAKKQFITRITNLKKRTEVPQHIKFEVYDEKNKFLVFKGQALRSDFSDWPGIYYIGDFSGLKKPGRYFMKVEISDGRKQIERLSFPFEVGHDILSRYTSDLELNFLKEMHCGEKCHFETPLKGGYHDTRFDISQRMWAIPSVVLGVKEMVEKNSFVRRDAQKFNDWVNELVYGVTFCANFPEEDGTVSWEGIESDFEKAGMAIGQWLQQLGPLKAEEDKLERKKFKNPSFHATCFNVVAISEALPLLENHDELINKIRDVQKRSWSWIDNQNLTFSHDYGCYLDAATALYNSTKDASYLHKVPETTKSLLKNQALDYTRFERDACGDFYYSDKVKDFRFHYKYTSFNIAINRALLRLQDILDRSDPLWFDVYYANYVFFNSYLPAMAGKSIYGQLADNLEPDREKNFKIYYFAGKKAEPAAAHTHGLNCDHFALGWMAMKWAQKNGDLKYQDLAEDQLDWLLGKNPFGFCMLIGRGSRNPTIIADLYDKALPGSIPNGPASVDGQSLAYNPSHFGNSEEWIPHNGDYLKLLAHIENPPALKGRVTRGGIPVTDGTIKVIFVGQVLQTLKTDKEGRWFTSLLKYPGNYKIEISDDSHLGKSVREVSLVSGQNRAVDVDFERDFTIRLVKLESLGIGKQSTVYLEIKNNTDNSINPDILVRGRGLEWISRPSDLTEKLDGNEKRVYAFVVQPTGKEPFFLRAEDLKDADVVSEMYELVK